MAGINEKLNQNRSRNNTEVFYTGRWVVGGGAGAVTKSSGGVGMTLARTGLGLYTLTLEATPAAVLQVDAVRVSNVGVISTLTYTATGATFRTGLYASPQTVGECADGEIISVQAAVLKSLVK